MELNPQKSLDDLEDCYKRYLNAPAARRGERAAPLQRAIARCEIEVGNLSHHVDGDVDARRLYKRLICTVELARGSMPQA